MPGKALMLVHIFFVLSLAQQSNEYIYAVCDIPFLPRCLPCTCVLYDLDLGFYFIIIIKGSNWCRIMFVLATPSIPNHARISVFKFVLKFEVRAD